jgi:single-strand DNA-binding protein
MDMNRLVLAGRLARDPEVREIVGGVRCCKLTIVTEYLYKKKDGGQAKELCFVECTVWNQQVDRCATFLRKGSAIAAEGRLKQEKWTDKETQKSRTKYVLVAERLDFAERPQAPIQKTEPLPGPVLNGDHYDDDLPF